MQTKHTFSMVTRSQRILRRVGFTVFTLGLLLIAGLMASSIARFANRGAQAAALMTNFTVNSKADGTLAALAGNATCDLREAIAAANTNAAVGQCPAGMAGMDTITFAPNVTGTITLTAGELMIGQALTITGPGADSLTISGNQVSRVFNIAAGNFDVTLSGLTIANGQMKGANVNPIAGNSDGGGIRNASIGTVEIANCTLSGNSAIGGEARAELPTSPETVSPPLTGGKGNGGGIFNADAGTIRIINSTLTANSATGGNANNSGDNLLNVGGESGGGGIFNAGAGTVTLTSTTVSENSVTGGSAVGDGWLPHHHYESGNARQWRNRRELQPDPQRHARRNLQLQRHFRRAAAGIDAQRCDRRTDRFADNQRHLQLPPHGCGGWLRGFARLRDQHRLSDDHATFARQRLGRRKLRGQRRSFASGQLHLFTDGGQSAIRLDAQPFDRRNYRFADRHRNLQFHRQRANTERMKRHPKLHADGSLSGNHPVFPALADCELPLPPNRHRVAVWRQLRLRGDGGCAAHRFVAQSGNGSDYRHAHDSRPLQLHHHGIRIFRRLRRMRRGTRLQLHTRRRRLSDHHARRFAGRPAWTALQPFGDGNAIRQLQLRRNFGKPSAGRDAVWQFGDALRLSDHGGNVQFHHHRNRFSQLHGQQSLFSDDRRRRLTVAGLRRFRRRPQTGTSCKAPMALCKAFPWEALVWGMYPRQGIMTVTERRMPPSGEPRKVVGMF